MWQTLHPTPIGVLSYCTCSAYVEEMGCCKRPRPSATAARAIASAAERRFLASRWASCFAAALLAAFAAQPPLPPTVGSAAAVLPA